MLGGKQEQAWNRILPFFFNIISTPHRTSSSCHFFSYNLQHWVISPYLLVSPSQFAASWIGEVSSGCPGQARCTVGWRGGRHTWKAGMLPKNQWEFIFQQRNWGKDRLDKFQKRCLENLQSFMTSLQCWEQTYLEKGRVAELCDWRSPVVSTKPITPKSSA